MRLQCGIIVAIVLAGQLAAAEEPADPPAFKHARVTDAWEAYRGQLTFGNGQTLALVDDGCTLSMPEWSQSDGAVPKVLVSYDSVDGDNDPKHEGKGYHGSTIGIPSSVNYKGKLGVAFNDQVAVIRALECCHCNVTDRKTLAAGLQWVIEHHKEFHITTVNLAPVDDLEHGEPVPTEIDAKLKKLRELGIWVSAPTGNHSFTNGISWPACQPFTFAIGAVRPDEDEVYLDRHAKVDLLVPAAATSSSNAIACGAAILLREAIEKTGYDWKRDAPNLPEAMLAIMQRTGAVVEDPASKLTFRRLDVKAALDHVFQNGNKKDTPKVTFEEHVLPILKSRCVKCHAGAEPAEGLRLTSRREILRGGKSGPAMRIAAAESSLLWEKLASNQMPKGGPPLSAAEKGVIRSWINDGAISTDATDEDAKDLAEQAGDQSRDHWAFRPPVRPPVPTVQHADRVINAIDSFVIAALEAKGLKLSAEASREVLLRRASFDLIGLPPSPEEVREFLADRAELAYERLIDRLLASPQYGERWGRHWLDLAGYADSAGVLSEDRPLPTAFRYRDYVIRAFNSDKPYDRFLQEQIAGDELTDYWTAYEKLDRLPDEVIEAVTATGYLRCAPDSSRPDFSTIKNADAQYFYPTINDTLQIVASSTMGLTLQCARCHSHKFDPIPQVEYYRLQSIFMAAFRPRQWIPQMERRVLVASAAQKKTADEHNGKLDVEIARLKKEAAELRAQYKQKLFDERLVAVSEPIRADVKQAVSKPADQRNPVEKYLAEKFQSLLQPDDKTLEKLLPETFADYRSAVDQQNAAIAAQERQRKHFDELRAIYDLPGPVVTPLLRRGDALTPGPPVEPGVLSSLTTPVAFQWTPPAAEAKTSGRRLAFARWLTQPDHPLTARVMVNRIWLHHFGEGIVSTPEDFGTLGSAPSHPQLLDWLAHEFVESGWSIKHIHRLIMTSNAYRQHSTFEETLHARAREVDPDNQLLWRQRLRRVDAEPLRDAMLSAAGLLDQRFFGSPIPVARRPDGEVNIADGQNDRRRSIYVQVLRGNPLTMLQAHDQPVMETNCTRRSRSTVSTQALTLLNSDASVAYAQAFADRALRESPDSPINLVALVALSREATSDELKELETFLAEQQARYSARGDQTEAARRKALVDLCHMLLAANEFVYVD